MRRLLRRNVHRALQILYPPQARIVFRENLGISLSGFPVDPLRAEFVFTHLMEEGLVHRRMICEPLPVSVQQLLLVHEDEYLQELDQEGALTRTLGFPLDEPVHRQLLEIQRLMVGGTVLAARIAVDEGRLVLHLGGGLHHAHADRGRGFCIFNDVAVAIRALRHEGFRGRVLVIDLDLHDGDGTRAIFADDPTVFTYSVHNKHWGPIEAEASNSIELGAGVDDELYLRTLQISLPEVLRRFRPQLVFYLAGCDPAHDDKLGNWKITPEGMLARDRFVMERLRRQQPATVVLMAGGYGHRAWRYSARFLAWQLGQDPPVEPPATPDVALARYRHLARLIDSSELSGREAATEDDWGLTEDDLMPGLGGPRKESRYLDFYTLYGIELALERLGFLERLRNMGFEHPHITLDLSGDSGDTIRIWSSPRQKELLAELRGRRDRATVPGHEMLFIEWLLLQNPRAEFTPERPRLPGQEHPGLGVLRDVAMTLVLICDRLQLDGVSFIPSHYHIAAQARGRLHFLEPRHEALFRALERLFRGLDLPTASGHVHSGEVIDQRTGEALKWERMPMVLPVAEELGGRIGSEEFDREVEASRAELRLALRKLGPG